MSCARPDPTTLLHHRKLTAYLRSHGFHPVRRGGGSHEVWANQRGVSTAISIHHGKDLTKWRVINILKACGLWKDDTYGRNHVVRR